MNRRGVLIGLSAVTTAGLAGCSALPEPTEEDLDPEEVKNNAEKIPYDDLIRNEDQYEGDNIHVPREQITQVLGDEDEGLQFRVYLRPEEYEDDVLIRWGGGDRFLEDDIIEVWGVYNGLVTYDTAIGGERTIPDITAVDIEPLEEG